MPVPDVRIWRSMAGEGDLVAATFGLPTREAVGEVAGSVIDDGDNDGLRARAEAGNRAAKPIFFPKRTQSARARRSQATAVSPRGNAIRSAARWSWRGLAASQDGEPRRCSGGAIPGRPMGGRAGHAFVRPYFHPYNSVGPRGREPTPWRIGAGQRTRADPVDGARGTTRSSRALRRFSAW